LTAYRAADKRAVFMGDSITDGWGRKYGKFFPGKPYVNRGISGQTTPQMLVRMYPDVIELKPAAMVLLAGTNDVARNTGPSTAEMIQQNIIHQTVRVALDEGEEVETGIDKIREESFFEKYRKGK
jgi:lysophospholipase L1-like esterase